MFYLLLGIVFTLIQIIIFNQLKKKNVSQFWLSNALLLIANISILFSIAWVYESILETEIQAAMMGLLFFGGPGIILGIITYRINKSTAKN